MLRLQDGLGATAGFPEEEWKPLSARLKAPSTLGCGFETRVADLSTFQCLGPVTMHAARAADPCFPGPEGFLSRGKRMRADHQRWQGISGVLYSDGNRCIHHNSRAQPPRSSSPRPLSSTERGHCRNRGDHCVRMAMSFMQSAAQPSTPKIHGGASPRSSLQT